MKKTVIRYFIDFVSNQEKWLNKMLARGFRLVRCGKLLYEFEQCTPDEYQYRIEFAGDKNFSKQTDYKRFLEDLGYRVICKNINLNWSVGKMRVRPWANGTGKVATSPGAYNNELLIVEKKNDGKAFNLHTDTQDVAIYFRAVRNSCFYVAVVGIIFAALFTASIYTTFNFSWGALPDWCGGVLFAAIGAVGIFLGITYAILAKHYRELSKTNE